MFIFIKQEKTKALVFLIMKCNLEREQASRDRLDQLLGYEAGKGSINWETSKKDIFCHYDGVFENFLIELKELTYKGKGLMVDEQKIKWLQELVEQQHRKDALVIWTIEGTKDIYMTSVKLLFKYLANGTAWIQQQQTDNGYKPVVWINFKDAEYREGNIS